MSPSPARSRAWGGNDYLNESSEAKKSCRRSPGWLGVAEAERGETREAAGEDKKGRKTYGLFNDLGIYTQSIFDQLLNTDKTMRRVPTKKAFASSGNAQARLQR